MPEPAHHHVGKRREPAATDREIERGVKAVAASPIGRGIVVVQHVDFCVGGQPEHGHERRRMRARPRDQLVVGGNQRAAMSGEPLRAEQQLGCAQRERIVAAVEQVA